VEETQFGAMALGRIQRSRCARPDRSALGGVLIAAAKSIYRQPAQPRGIDNDDATHTQQGAADRAR
jgi:hypothetical protein